MFPKQELQAFLNSAKNGKLIIFCVGNELRGDDALGPVIYNKLQGQLGNKILMYKVESSLENYFSILSKRKATHCLIIDTVNFGDNRIQAGTVGFFCPSDLERKQVSFSTHFIPMKVIIEYMKEKSGTKIRILGVQPKNLNFDSEMSKSVVNAVEKIVNLLIPLLK